MNNKMFVYYYDAGKYESNSFIGLLWEIFKPGIYSNMVNGWTNEKN